MTTPAATRRLHLDARAIVIVVLCCIVWGLGQVASKVGLTQIPPLTQGGLRSLGAGVLVLLWARRRGIPLWQRDGTWRAGPPAGPHFGAEFACVPPATRRVLGTLHWVTAAAARDGEVRR